jgi:hypothetical protein
MSENPQRQREPGGTGLIDDPAIQTQIDEVDAVIREVRAAAFSLNPPPATPAGTVTA